MKRILRIGRAVKVRQAKGREICGVPLNAMNVDTKAELIQALTPLHCGM
jgi:hypothetical protein